MSAYSEREVVGACIAVPSRLSSVRDWLLPEHFVDEWCSRVYAHVLSLPPEQLDVIVIAETAAEKGLDPSEVIELASSTYGTGMVLGCAELILDAAKRRDLDAIGRRLGPMAASQGVEQAVGWAQGRLNAVASSASRAGAISAKDAMRLWFADYQKRVAAGSGLIGLSTPWEEINAALGGLEATDLIILAARPGSGKSVMCENIATHVALGGSLPMVFSLEMSSQQWMQRTLAQVASIPHEVLRLPNADHGPDSDLYFERMVRNMDVLNASPLIIDAEPGLTVDQISARAEREHMRRTLSLVVVDHMHRIRRAGKNEVVELGEIARGLKNLAKRLNVPVFAAAQLNRGNTARNEKRPNMADLRGSGEIEQEADVILLAHREDYYKKAGEDRDNKLEIIIGKHRHAEAGKTIILRENFRFMRADTWVGDYPDDPVPKPKTQGRSFKEMRGARE